MKAYYDWREPNWKNELTAWGVIAFLVVVISIVAGC